MEIISPSETRKTYYEKNKEKCKAYQKKYIEKNKEKLNQYGKKYREEHRTKVRGAWCDWFCRKWATQV